MSNRASQYASHPTDIFTNQEWDELCARFDYRCVCCGERKPLTADHVVPRVKDGRNDISNIQPLCKSCNSAKGGRYIDYQDTPFSNIRLSSQTIPTVMVRIARMTDAERTLINAMTPQERKDALVRFVLEGEDNMLWSEITDRIRLGIMQPQTANADGQPYPTNGQTMYFRDEQEPMKDLGRVPGYPGRHVLRRANGELTTIAGYDLHGEGERWDDVLGDDAD